MLTPATQLLVAAHRAWRIGIMFSVVDEVDDAHVLAGIARWVEVLEDKHLLPAKIPIPSTLLLELVASIDFRCRCVH